MAIDLADSDVAGDLGVMHLKRLWSRCLRERSGIANGEQHEREWAMDNVVYHGLNLPLEETIKFLYNDAPSFRQFEEWVLHRNNGVIHKNVADRVNAAILALTSGEQTHRREETVEPVLCEDDINKWNENGYLVVSGLYSIDEVKAAEYAVWKYLDLDPHDPDTWYGRSRDHGIMVQMFRHPALDAIRQAPKLRSVFAQLWKTSNLWISTDRVSFNPPERPGYEFPGPRLHWDVSLDLPIPFGVQGLVYLTDTEPEQGAFTCVPGFHKRIESWLGCLPPQVDPRMQDLDKLGAIPIPGKAGDLVVWHQALPHGSRPNRLTGPRIVQYVTMFPADASYADNWK
jgi:hypothetical protein